MTRRRTAITALLLLIVGGAVGRSMLGTQLDSLTVDESWHIVAGVEYSRTGDYRLNPEHPPMVKRWVGMFIPSSFTLRPKAQIVEKDAERKMVEDVFFKENDFRAAHATARTATYLLNAILLFGLALLLWRSLGPAWAVGTTAFIALEPTMSAHMPVVMTDLPVALTLAMCVASAGLLLSSWQWRWVLGLGISMGLALAAKHSALPGLAGLGFFCALVAVWQASGWRREEKRRFAWSTLLTNAGKLAVVVLVAIGVLWAMYGFHFHAAPDGTDLFNRPMVEKIAELHSANYRTLIGFLDQWHILPKSYLWGLADTVRAGVEGRGQTVYYVWGGTYFGAPPWFTWPSFIITKVPLALMALTVAGIFAIRRLTLSPAARWTLRAALVLSVVHFWALLGSQGTYAGVRHALPIVAVMALLAGAAAAYAWQTRQKGWIAVCVGGLALTVLTTIREPRLWEYHNALAGGTEGAGYQFGHEGTDLGQRAYEIAAFNDSVMAATKLPVYTGYWLPRSEAEALDINLARRVPTLSDSNIAGVYEGFFLYGKDSEVSRPEWDWDADEVFRELTPVARLGYVTIWRGRQTLPITRAYNVEGRVVEYIYMEGGTDWALVAKRLEEALAVIPFSTTAGLELGNAYLRLGQREDAIRAYATPLAHLDRGLMGEEIQKQFREQIARLESGVPLTEIAVLRNPSLE